MLKLNDMTPTKEKEARNRNNSNGHDPVVNSHIKDQITDIVLTKSYYMCVNS